MGESLKLERKPAYGATCNSCIQASAIIRRLYEYQVEFSACKISRRILTMDFDGESFANWGRNAVAGDAEVGSHIGPLDAAEEQNLTVIVPHHWNAQAKRVNRYVRVLKPPVFSFPRPRFAIRRWTYLARMSIWSEANDALMCGVLKTAPTYL